MRNKLKEGQVFKNYKELCNYLGWNITNGKSKIKQIENLRYLCRFERVGHKYVIVKILNDKLPEKQPRISNHAKYVQPFEVLIKNFFEESESSFLVIGKFDFLCTLEVITPDVSEMFSVNYISESCDIDTKSKTFAVFKSIFLDHLFVKLDASLESMHKRHLIDLKKVMLIKTYDNLTPRKATESENAFLNKISDEVLEELKCKTKNEVIIKNLNIVYKAKIKEKISKSKFKHIKFYEQGYLIGYAKKVEEYEFTKDYQIEFSKKRINNLTRITMKKKGERHCKSNKDFIVKSATQMAKDNTQKEINIVLKQDADLFSFSTLEDLRDTIYSSELKTNFARLEKKIEVLDLVQWNKLVDTFVPFREYDLYDVADYDFNIKRFLDFMRITGYHIS